MRKKHNVNRVWTTDDLNIFHELQKPVSIVVSSVYGSSQSGHGLTDVVRVLFANDQCIEQYGEPRSQEECSRLLSLLSEEAQEKRRTWLAKAAMGKAGHQAWLDSRQLLSPVFSGVSQDAPYRMLQIDSKPIKVETSPGHVENALLHVIEAEQSSHTELRVAAMHDRSPIHTFLFDSQGSLLTANKAALRFCQTGAGLSGAHVKAVTMRSLFDMGVYSGGAQEAEAAYDEAVNAVFNLQVECHRHAQPHISKKDGTTKWAMLEMWPMPDPVTGSPAALIQRYNISQQKELELQLASQQVALQRHNQELEQDSMALHEEQRKLEREARSLALRLDAVLKDKFTPRTSFDSDTPIDKTLKFLQEVIAGDVPPVEIALELYSILSESDTNLRQPVGLENQLMKNSMGSEVGQSILQLLQGNISSPKAAQPLVAEGPFCLLPNRFGGPEPAALPQSSPALARHGSIARMQLEPFIPANVTPDVERRLHDAENNWQFDIFGFAEATKGSTLSLLFYHFMKQMGIIQEFHLDEHKLCKYVQKIESGYDSSNPYHNSVHVASVLQMSHMLICHGGVLKSKAMNRMQHVATYWSALVHDHEHEGVNNDFLIKIRHPLAITYNDTSPLENHHCASAFRLLCQPEYTYFPFKRMLDIVSEPQVQLRSTTISQVLGTDMKKHFDITSRFQAAFKRPAAGNGPEAVAPASTVDWDAVKPEDRTLIEQMVLKCADIGHLAAGPRTHKRWALQLEEEFFRQGDRERAHGLPLSPLMDRSTQGGMTRSQMGFFSIVGIPLFKAMAELFEESKPMLEGVLTNYHHWEAATPDTQLPP